VSERAASDHDCTRCSRCTAPPKQATHRAVNLAAQPFFASFELPVQIVRLHKIFGIYPRSATSEKFKNTYEHLNSKEKSFLKRGCVARAKTKMYMSLQTKRNTATPRTDRVGWPVSQHPTAVRERAHYILV
jgi:hypothetical protein